MYIYKEILELKAEKKRLDRAIAVLEQGDGAGPPPGRRTWNADARRAAAERMKKYWEQRKQQADSEATT
jgi:hypothetical protein